MEGGQTSSMHAPLISKLPPSWDLGGRSGGVFSSGLFPWNVVQVPDMPAAGTLITFTCTGITHCITSWVRYDCSTATEPEPAVGVLWGVRTESQGPARAASVNRVHRHVHSQACAQSDKRV